MKSFKNIILRSCAEEPRNAKPSGMTLTVYSFIRLPHNVPPGMVSLSQSTNLLHLNTVSRQSIFCSDNWESACPARRNFSLTLFRGFVLNSSVVCKENSPVLIINNLPTVHRALMNRYFLLKYQYHVDWLW